jgi:hypothetical protein
MNEIWLVAFCMVDITFNGIAGPIGPVAPVASVAPVPDVSWKPVPYIAR